MVGSPKFFIRNRKDSFSITQKRVCEIMGYISYCYQELILNSGEIPVYSKVWVKSNTAFSLEDYLKMELVDKYLIPNKEYLKSKISALEQINFAYETQKRFTDVEGKEHVDKIDIYINKIGLQEQWGMPDEHLYLAVECKRIKSNSDTNHYINDIQKQCDRVHKDLRIPFEGMIAFIENSTLNHTIVSNEINVRLKSSKTIVTKQYLTAETVYKSFAGSYLSSHQKNNSSRPLFWIYHLLLDYSMSISD